MIVLEDRRVYEEQVERSLWIGKNKSLLPSVFVEQNDRLVLRFPAIME